MFLGEKWGWKGEADPEFLSISQPNVRSSQAADACCSKIRGRSLFQSLLYLYSVSVWIFLLLGTLSSWAWSFLPFWSRRQYFGIGLEFLSVILLLNLSICFDCWGLVQLFLFYFIGFWVSYCLYVRMWFFVSPSLGEMFWINAPLFISFLDGFYCFLSLLIPSLLLILFW